MFKKRLQSHYPGLIISRAGIGIVLFINLQCAIVFFLSPASYTASFELTGLPGETVIRGMALLILMWNIPYIFALINPHSYKTSYLQACLMQTTGLLGETLISLSLPTGHMAIQAALQRFIIFDGIGLLLLCLGYFSIPETVN
jgi:hypothetical protein